MLACTCQPRSTKTQVSRNIDRTHTVSAPPRNCLSGDRTVIRLVAWIQPPGAQRVRIRTPNIKDASPQLLHITDSVLTLCLRILGNRCPPVCAPNPSSSSFVETFSCTKACMDVILARPALESDVRHTFCPIGQWACARI